MTPQPHPLPCIARGTAVLAALLLALVTARLPAEGHNKSEEVPPSFTADYGTIAPGDVLNLTVTHEHGIKTGRVTETTEGPSAWTGGVDRECGVAQFSAAIPADFSGRHEGSFGGELCVGGGGGTGDGGGDGDEDDDSEPPPPPTWSGEALANVCRTRINESGELQVQQTAGQDNALQLTATTTDPPVTWQIVDELEHVKTSTAGNRANIKYLAGQGRQDSATDEIQVVAHAAGNSECMGSRTVTVFNMWRPGELSRRKPAAWAFAVQVERLGLPPVPPNAKSDMSVNSEVSYGPDEGDQLDARYRVIGRAQGSATVAAIIRTGVGDDDPVGVATAAGAVVLSVEGEQPVVASALAAGQAETENLGSIQVGLTVPIGPPGGAGFNVSLTRNILNKKVVGDRNGDRAVITGGYEVEGQHSPGNPLVVSRVTSVGTAIDLNVPPGWGGKVVVRGDIDWLTERDEIVWSPIH